mgnify:FL=1
MDARLAACYPDIGSALPRQGHDDRQLDEEPQHRGRRNTDADLPQKEASTPAPTPKDLRHRRLNVDVGEGGPVWFALGGGACCQPD